MVCEEQYGGFVAQTPPCAFSSARPVFRFFTIRGFPKIKVPFLRIPRTRTVAFLGLSGGSPILGTSISKPCQEEYGAASESRLSVIQTLTLSTSLILWGSKEVVVFQQPFTKINPRMKASIFFPCLHSLQTSVNPIFGHVD